MDHHQHAPAQLASGATTEDDSLRSDRADLLDQIMDRVEANAERVAFSLMVIAVVVLTILHFLHLPVGNPLYWLLGLVLVLVIMALTQHRALKRIGKRVDRASHVADRLKELETRLTNRVEMVSRAYKHAAYSNQIGEYRAQSMGFDTVAKTILDSHDRDLIFLAEGRMRLPANSAIEAQRALLSAMLDESRKMPSGTEASMDAVSLNDLDLWQGIVQPRGREDHYQSFAQRYYDAVLHFVNEKATVTRIFLFRQRKLEYADRQELLAKILAKHHEDGIHFALAFIENLTKWTCDFIDEKKVRADFALYNRDAAATFFVDENKRLLDMVFRDASGQGAIEKQRALYRTLASAVVLTSPDFLDKASAQHSKSEWERVTATAAQYWNGKEQSFALDLAVGAGSKESNESRILNEIKVALARSKEVGSVFGMDPRPYATPSSIKSSREGARAAAGRREDSNP